MMLAIFTVCAFIPSCAQSADIDDSSDGKCGYPGFGTIVARAGDVDRDGTPDFIVGDGGDAGVDDALRLWIVSGKDGGVFQRIAIPRSGGLSASIDGGMDVDGDGVPDVLAATFSGASPSRASARVHSGKTGGMLASVDVTGRAWNGPWARFASDVDGDGAVDIGFLHTKPGEKHGTLTIHSVKKGITLAEISVANDCEDPIATFADVGDLDGDGTRDLVVVLGCAFGERCVVRAYSGKSRAMLWEHRPKRTRVASQAALAVIGDIDGDRVSDLAVGICDGVDLLRGKTGEIVRRLLVQDAFGEELPAWTLKQEERYSALGFARGLAALGDVDGDGVPDLAVSETEHGLEGRIVARSGATGARIWISANPYGDDLYHVGWQLAAIGDVDGDGIADLAAGTCGYMAQAKGRACVVSGRDGSLLMLLERWGNDVRVIRLAPRVAKPR
jgi:hypothetical protein